MASRTRPDDGDPAETSTGATTRRCRSASSQLERPGRSEADRRRARLEVRVSPVSMVFGLPQVALEVEDETTSVGELHLEMIERGKSGENALPSKD